MTTNKADTLWVTDLVMAILGTITVGTGLIMFFVVPPRSAHEGAKYFLALHRHDWGMLHFAAGAVLVLLVLLHLWHHRRWIVGRLGAH